MSRFSKSERIRIWLDRLNRFASSDQSVASFCQSEGISAPSFYQWKRRLAPSIDPPKPRRRSAAQNVDRSPRGFAELVVTDRADAGATISLPGNIQIQLGDHQATSAAIVQQVLQHACSPSWKGDSC